MTRLTVSELLDLVNRAQRTTRALRTLRDALAARATFAPVALVFESNQADEAQPDETLARLDALETFLSDIIGSSHCGGASEDVILELEPDESTAVMPTVAQAMVDADRARQTKEFALQVKDWPEHASEMTRNLDAGVVVYAVRADSVVAAKIDSILSRVQRDHAMGRIGW